MIISNTRNTILLNIFVIKIFFIAIAINFDGKPHDTLTFYIKELCSSKIYIFVANYKAKLFTQHKIKKSYFRYIRIIMRAHGFIILLTIYSL